MATSCGKPVIPVQVIVSINGDEFMCSWIKLFRTSCDTYDTHFVSGYKYFVNNNHVANLIPFPECNCCGKCSKCTVAVSNSCSDQYKICPWTSCNLVFPRIGLIDDFNLAGSVESAKLAESDQQEEDDFLLAQSLQDEDQVGFGGTEITESNKQKTTQPSTGKKETPVESEESEESGDMVDVKSELYTEESAKSFKDGYSFGKQLFRKKLSAGIKDPYIARPLRIGDAVQRARAFGIHSGFTFEKNKHSQQKPDKKKCAMKRI